MKLQAVVAMSSNRVIGRDGDLPWRLPEDLKWFKKLTVGHPIVMGRKTMESLPGGKPLPKRRNIVVSRSLKSVPDGFELVHDLNHLAENFPDEKKVSIIGGAEIFKTMLPLCDEIFLTYIYDQYEGDTFLPVFEGGFEQKEILGKNEDFEVRRYVAIPESERRLHQAHDSFFRNYFRRPECAAPVLKWLLPENVADRWDGETMALMPNSYVDEDLRPFASDLLWQIGADDGFVYLLWEHQKRPDPLMPLRCLRYLAAALTDYSRGTMLKKGQRKLPPAMAVVLHQGPEKWNYPTSFHDLVDFGENAESDFGTLIPDFEFQLVSLPTTQEGELPQDKFAFAGLTLMRAAAQGACMDWLEARRDLIGEWLREGRFEDILKVVLFYATNEISPQQKPRLHRLAQSIKSEKTTDMEKSLYDVLVAEAEQRARVEGRVEGKEEGKAEGMKIMIRNLFAHGTTAEEIAEIADISVAEALRMRDEK